MAGSTTTIALAVYLFTDKKPLKRFGAPSGVINTQLKQGVRLEGQSTLNRPSNIERPTRQRPTSNSEARIRDQKINPIQGE